MSQKTAEAIFLDLETNYADQFRPLLIASNQAWWHANLTGLNEAFQAKRAAEDTIIELHADQKIFTKLETLRNECQISDPTLQRQLEVMYRTFLPGQADQVLQKQIVALENDIEKTFNNHRNDVDGELLSENDIRAILTKSKDSVLVEKAWKAYMKVGSKTASKLNEIVRLRNEQARQLGHDNFYHLQLFLQEIDENTLFKVLDDLDELTRNPFSKLKFEIDNMRSRHFGFKISDLRPWHFGDIFFQDTPESSDDLEALFRDSDLPMSARNYYSSLGMDVSAILERSDLYEKKGKTPHAFEVDIDRSGDVRILCNLKPNLRWMDTLLHELGHAVYDSHISQNLPFVLRTASNPITTEGCAMMMGAMVKTADFLELVMGLESSTVEHITTDIRRNLQAEKLIFSRWAQVVTRFEKHMYANPSQDLSQLWWGLVEHYQDLVPPAEVNRPDYAAKVHVVCYPAYYHSYMLGDLFAAQVSEHIARKILGDVTAGKSCFSGRLEVGDFLQEHLFAPGNLYSWNELTQRITGSPLSAKAFARQHLET